MRRAVLDRVLRDLLILEATTYRFMKDLGHLRESLSGLRESATVARKGEVKAAQPAIRLFPPRGS